LKCGDAAANEFHAWWSICSRVDVAQLLLTGTLEHSLTDVADVAVVHYAAIFALAQEINQKGVKKEYAGLAKYLEVLHAEHRAALLMQLSSAAQARIGTVLPMAADLLMSPLAPLGA
jgi:hypothetical protein